MSILIGIFYAGHKAPALVNDIILHMASMQKRGLDIIRDEGDK